MEFLTWWFGTHYILSTIFSPGWTLLWAIFNDLTARACVALFACLFLGGVKLKVG